MGQYPFHSNHMGTLMTEIYILLFHMLSLKLHLTLSWQKEKNKRNVGSFVDLLAYITLI